MNIDNDINNSDDARNNEDVVLAILEILQSSSESNEKSIILFNYHESYTQSISVKFFLILHYLYTKRLIDSFHYVLVQKNKPLFKHLNDPNNFIGNIILFKYTKSREIVSLRADLSRLIVEREMSDIRKTANPFAYDIILYSNTLNV